MAEVSVRPDSGKIRYMGRVDFSDPKAPRFDWPGIEIEICFIGTKADIFLEDGGNDYNVILDGKQYGIIKTETGKARYEAVNGAKNAKHTVKITKRTEGYDGLAVFRGFVLNDGAKVCSPRKNKQGRILFVGDSLSVGYGVEGKSVECENERKYKNNRCSFASVAARKLNAEYHVLAVSGRGVVRNYNEPKQKSKRPLPSYLDNTLYNDDSLKWDHSAWVPDTIVINLGTNDFSTEPRPGKTEFLTGYRNLTVKLRKLYPEARIYCCVGPAQSEPFFQYMADFFKRNKDKKICRVNMAMMTERDWGCDYHPNVGAAERMAEELTSRLKQKQG